MLNNVSEGILRVLVPDELLRHVIPGSATAFQSKVTLFVLLEIFTNEDV